MRLRFTSEKRPTNLAKRLRAFLEAEGLPASMSASREALACASGYRNWNELLNVIKGSSQAAEAIDGPAPSDCDMYFAQRLARKLDIPEAKAREAVDAIRPFEARRVGHLTNDHISLLASNICSSGFTIEDLSDAVFSGFSMVRTDPEGDSDFASSKDNLASGRLCLFVSRDGRIVSDVNPPPRKRSCYGPDDFTEIMGIAGLVDLPVTPPSSACDLPGFAVVQRTLECLDRQALLLMKCAGSFDQWAYMDALQIPDTAPLLTLMVDYPALATQFADISRFDDLTGEKPPMPKTAFRSGALSDDPIGAFAEAVYQKSKSLWPTITVSPERLRTVTERYLSINPRDEYPVEETTPAFMCHLPDAIAPTTARDMRCLADFVDRHLHVFGAEGMCVMPTTFAAAFRSREGVDWSRVGRLSTVRHFPFHQTIGAVTLGVAGREIGYEVSAASFEDASGLGDELLYKIGHLLSKEASLDFVDVADGYRKMEADLWSAEGKMEMDDSEFCIEEDREFRLYRSLGFIHAKHGHRTAAEVLSSHGYDIHEIIGRFETPPGRLTNTSIQA